MKSNDVKQASGWLAADGKFFECYGEAADYNKSIMTPKERLLEALDSLPEDSCIKSIHTDITLHGDKTLVIQLSVKELVFNDVFRVLKKAMNYEVQS